jgi:hypothetical protein
MVNGTNKFEKKVKIGSIESQWNKQKSKNNTLFKNMTLEN